MGKIHSIETFGAVDGPGIRFVIFMQGCPMRCLYCHNPDTWNINNGKEISMEDLLIEIHKYKHYFGKDGGVTISGGEPLMQMEFVTKLFKALKSENIHTCLDTSGVLFSKQSNILQKINELLKYTDLVLLDIKHINNNNHKNLTGFNNDNILDFARFLNSKNIPTWVRYVLVPTINEDIDSLTALRKFLDTLNNVKKIEILPYHTMGISKYKELGINYQLNNVTPPTDKQIEIATQILKGEN